MNPLLEVDYFNPVVEDWTLECQAEEQRQKETSDIELYVITSTSTGVYSAAEMVEAAIKRGPARAVVALLSDDEMLGWTRTRLSPFPAWDEGQRRSWAAVCRRVEANGGIWIEGSGDMVSLDDIAQHINSARADEVNARAGVYGEPLTPTGKARG